jgi:hypothetical protein
MGTSLQGDEELRTVGVRTTIGHTQQPVDREVDKPKKISRWDSPKVSAQGNRPFGIQWMSEVLVRERATVYRLSACAITFCKVCFERVRDCRRVGRPSINGVIEYLRLES